MGQTQNQPLYRFPDRFIEQCGDLYRYFCGRNSVLIIGGEIITFESFLIQEARDADILKSYF